MSTACLEIFDDSQSEPLGLHIKFKCLSLSFNALNHLLSMYQLSSLFSHLPPHAVCLVSWQISPPREKATDSDILPPFFACQILSIVLGSAPLLSSLLSLLWSFQLECIAFLCIFVVPLYFTVPRPMMSSLYFWSYQIACVLLENGNHITIMFISLCIVSSHIAFHTAVNCLMISLITPSDV